MRAEVFVSCCVRSAEPVPFPDHVPEDARRALKFLAADARTDRTDSNPRRKVNYLANKNIAYWFLALAAISIASWWFIVRWLLNQLESQRSVNANVTNKLIAYMEGDHSKMLVVSEKVLLVMDKVLERLERRPFT